nr:hypothetical protein [Tanacetum cinerariifolium]
MNRSEIVFNQSTKNLECSSSSEKQKRMPQEKPMSSEVHPKANSWSVPTRVLTDEAYTTEVVTGALPPSLNVKPVANNVAAAQKWWRDCRSRGLTETEEGVAGSEEERVYRGLREKGCR